MLVSFVHTHFKEDNYSKILIEEQVKQLLKCTRCTNFQLIEYKRYTQPTITKYNIPEKITLGTVQTTIVGLVDHLLCLQVLNVNCNTLRLFWAKALPKTCKYKVTDFIFRNNLPQFPTLIYTWLTISKEILYQFYIKRFHFPFNIRYMKSLLVQYYSEF